ncbi:adenosylcobinamide-phosphate synthase CbiB [Granulosicoccus sp. 3-233]|uniref:adenosylcobinamide-phosphate synthase CbiB n=1 Tax=Granulosicoccus sp. 3-233 TaxID=3417969 RepID=UPI003D32CA4A
MLMLAALLLELLLGWPRWLFARVRHPVVWLGALISLLEQRFNKPSASDRQRYIAGALGSLLLIGLSAAVAGLLVRLLPDNPFGFLLEAMLASSLLAARSLYQHVAAVLAPLRCQDVPAARQAVSMIVGRDTRELEESGICSAALESLAENASDGVIAPLFWGVLLGLPGMAAYKAINTLDSMIGHRSEQYKDYGRFAARLDDVANFLPARVCAALFWLAAAGRISFAAVARQADHHRSPNAGWPESAMAFALDVRLSGPRVYQHTISDEPWLNPTGAAPGVSALQQGLRLYATAVMLSAALLLAALLGMMLLR